MSSTFESALYQGKVFHERLRPAVHRFEYSVCAWLFDLDELDSLNKLRGFSIDRFNLFSLYQRDHGDGSDIPLKEQIKQLVKQHLNYQDDLQVKLLCYPRVLGYVFNPLSVLYCYTCSKELFAIIYEVNNTFNQRQSYLIPIEEGQQNIIQQEADKTFYVSPFMPMQTRYHFILSAPGNSIKVDINQTDQQGNLFFAGFNGKKIPLTQSSLVKTYFRHPLMTFKIIAGIHWEALRLWKKGLKLQPRPQQSNYQVSLISYVRGKNQ